MRHFEQQQQQLLLRFSKTRMDSSDKMDNSDS